MTPENRQTGHIHGDYYVSATYNANTNVRSADVCCGKCQQTVPLETVLVEILNRLIDAQKVPQ